LVPADAFEDHRNGEPYLADWNSADEVDPCVVPPNYEPSWEPPAVRLDFRSWSFTIPAPSIAGYGPDDYEDRCYDLQVWIEKSTMDDILRPLCRELGVTLQTSIGFQSITSPVQMLKRAHELGKPVRIFYISDYDRAGGGMPVAVARQIEYWLPVYAPGADVKLTSLALTREQVAAYKLPIDNKGRVELDALEARVPGELEKLVRGAVEPFRDPTISDRLRSAEEEAKRIVRTRWTGLVRSQDQKLTAIYADMQAIVDRYEGEVAALNERLQADVAKFKRPLEELRMEVNAATEKFEPELPERPEPTECEEDDDEWLFASRRRDRPLEPGQRSGEGRKDLTQLEREYLNQLVFYKAHQRKNEHSSIDWDKV